MKKIKQLALATTSLLVLTACQSQNQAQQSIQLQHEKPSIVFSAKTTAEYGQEIDVMKYVVSGYWDDIELPTLNTSIIGEQELVFKLKGNNKELEKHFKVTVLDTLKPILEVNSDRVELQQGSTLDLSQFKASDSVDGELVVQLKEGLDTNVAGEHKAVIFATDKNGNTTEREIIVNVIEKPVEIATNNSNTEVALPSTGNLNNYSGNTASSGSSSSSGSSGVASEPSQPSQPTPPPAPVDEPLMVDGEIWVDRSGYDRVFYTEAEAIAYFEHMAEQDFIYDYKMFYASSPSNKNGGKVWKVRLIKR